MTEAIERPRRQYKVAENSPEYEEYRKFLKEYREFTDREDIFGMEEVDRLIFDYGSLDYSRATLEEREEISDRLSNSKKVLASLATDALASWCVAEFYEENGINNHGLQGDLWGLMGEAANQNKNRVPQEPINPFGISDEQYVLMLAQHVNLHKEKAKEFERRVPRLKRRFKKRLKNAQQQGVIPSEIPLDTRRIDRTQVVYSDGLTMHSKHGVAAGIFRDRLEKVRILEKYGEKRTEYFFIHEMLHALSGRTLLTKPYPTFPDVVVQRIGLYILGRFMWLDEAVTDILAGKLIDRSSPFPPYWKEIYLFELLLAKVPLNLFLNAYFENFDPSVPPHQRIPHWKYLQRTIDDAYSPGFLVRLDKFVFEKGINNAIKTVRQDPRLI